MKQLEQSFRRNLGQKKPTSEVAYLAFNEQPKDAPNVLKPHVASESPPPTHTHM